MSDPALPKLTSRQLRSDLPTILLASLVFATLSVAMAVLSQGFLEADGCSHFMDARFALVDKSLIPNVWGRPVCTMLYMLPASLPKPHTALLAVRFTSLAVALLLAWITYLIAIGENYRWPVLGFLFVLAQPLVFLHSFAELTELPFATLLGLSFLMYQRKRWLWLAIIAGWLPLSRPEGFGFLGLVAVGLIAHRRARWLPILVIPLILWNHVGWAWTGERVPWHRWLIESWPYSGNSLYERGALLHFVMLMPAVVSPLIFPATCIGLALLPRRRRPIASFLLHPSSLITLLPLLVLIGHSVLYWLGKMASSGEIRYMLIVAPFWALLSARGWEWLATRLRWRHTIRYAAIAAALPILANRFYTVLPLNAAPDWVQAQQLAQWYETTAHDHYPRIAAGHPGICFYLDIEPDDGRRLLEWTRDKLLNPPPGVVLVYDPIYGRYNSDANRSVTLEELLKAGWTPMPGAPVFKNWTILHSG